MPLHLLSFAGQAPGSVVYHGGNGYFYHKVNNRPHRKFAYFRCVHREKKSQPCPGSAKALLEQHLLFPLHNHSHPSNVLYPQVKALKRDIIARVKMGDQSPYHEIIQQEGQKYPPDVRAQVPMGSIQSRLHKIRSDLRPPVPRNLGVLGAHLLMPQYEHLTRCAHVPDSNFAGMCGRLADKTLSLVFITPEMKTFMQTRSTVFADGTERKKFRKPHVSQIFQLVTVWRFHTIQMLKALMQSRTEQAYVVLFEYMKELMPQFSPSHVKCDFEDGQINAWKTCFPNVSVEGCLWHFACAVWRHAKVKLGLYNFLNEEEEAKSIVRSVGALPLLPTHEIEGGLIDLGWEAIEKGYKAELKPFFQYMDNEWMRQVPVLSVKGSAHRTNNACESANRSLNKEIKVSNPNCFNVIRAFVLTNDRATADMKVLSNPGTGAPGRGRKVSVLRNDVVIKRLTTDLEMGDITRLEFLHKASRRLQNVFNKYF